jgi:hypothetical protein
MYLVTAEKIQSSMSLNVVTTTNIQNHTGYHGIIQWPVSAGMTTIYEITQTYISHVPVCVSMLSNYSIKTWTEFF